MDADLNFDRAEDFGPDLAIGTNYDDGKGDRERAPKGCILDKSEYEMPILRILANAGGELQTQEVLESLQVELKPKLLPNDYKRLKSGGIRWRNRAQLVASSLVKDRYLDSRSPHGIWRLTEDGGQRANNGG